MAQTLQETIDEALAENAEELSPKEREELKVAMHKIFEEGVVPGEALGISQELSDFFYATASRFYKNGKYNEAFRILSFLQALHPKEKKYLVGMAQILQDLKHFEMAASLYLVASALDPENPELYYTCADCYLKKGDPAPALALLLLAVEKCEGNAKFASLKSAAEALVPGTRAAVEKQSAS